MLWKVYLVHFTGLLYAFSVPQLSIIINICVIFIIQNY